MTKPISTDIPYVDNVLASLVHPEFERAFGRHMHLGYWPDPSKADGSIEDFARAGEIMAERVCRAADVKSGQRVLDVGCGFGGTLSHVNDTTTNVDLVGVNIDERQLERARAEVTAKPSNKVTFVRADACELPCDDHSFDAVMAVECIVHFPSRARFLREAWRVLKPNGRLMVSDPFVPALAAIPFLASADAMFGGNLYRSMGKSTLASAPLEAYQFLAVRAGLKLLARDDITAAALPSFPVFERLRRASVNSGPIENDHAIVWGFIEVAYRRRLLSYDILTFAPGSRPPLPDPGGVNVQGYMEGEDALALTSACSKWP
jgi:ubiquinone/menaquinone biosynthesis C-methylase UbiE